MELLVGLNEQEGIDRCGGAPRPDAWPPISFPRLILIDRGRIVADGPPDVVLAPDRIREAFGVDPALVRLRS